MKRAGLAMNEASSGSSGQRAEGQVVPLRRLDERLAGFVELSDEALLAACGVGDPAALGALFDRYHEAVFRLVSRLIRSEAYEVDDIVQTTFLEAWRSAKRYRGRGSVKSFLFGIAANTVKHHVRSAKRRRDAYADLPVASAAAAGTPHEAAQRAQEIQRLGAALEELPHDLRAAYVVCDLEELAGAEAAHALGIREGTLWRRLHEARRALREALGGTR
jgi:RNA polymerase sigma-70 factor (ECF subfamily)